MWHLSRTHLWVAGTLVATTAGLAWVLLGNAAPSAELVEPAAAPEAKDKPLPKDKRVVSDEERSELLARAQVWRRPHRPIRQASFQGRNLEHLTCKFKVDDLGGTTPKFDCELETGEEIRIKYGNGPEPPAEAAATRLLLALGFGADDVTLVEHLRCFGCPKEPFSIMKAVEITRAQPVYERIVDYDSYENFTWVALERKMFARPVETDRLEGWTFFELDEVREERGGAPRAHVDGLRLMAVLLAHWDNKAANQRLVCLSAQWPEGTPCPEPFLLMQDVGATFGPAKMNFGGWTSVPIWEDRRTCTVSMAGLPFDGATFGRATISEAGRQFAGGLLRQLSTAQLTELFASARFGEPRGLLSTPTPVADWVRVFEQKVRDITDGPACPQA